MKKINILCANGLEECEALLIHDLLSRAQFEVKLVNTMEQDEVISSHNLTFKTDVKLSEADHDVDAIFLPGGIKGSQNLRDNQKVQELILKAHQAQKLICAICAAPDILAQLGIVQDLEFTCYPGCDYHKKASTANIMIKDNVITAKALGASFELAYEMIKALSDEEKAKSIINQVYYSL